MARPVRYLHLNTTLVNLANMLFRTDFEGEGFALGVQLVWDWRLARVYDGEGQIIDECIWEQSRGLGLVVVGLD